MDGLARGRDLLEQRGEERLVLQDLEPVAVRVLAPGQRFDGGEPAGKRVDLVAGRSWSDAGSAPTTA